MAKAKSRRMFLGRFLLSGTRSVEGQLQIDGDATELLVHDDSPLDTIVDKPYIEGVAHTGEHISLIDCVGSSTRHIFRDNAQDRYSARIFAHYVCTGRSHLDPGKKSIAGIHFSTDDLGLVFFAPSAFGFIGNAEEKISLLFPELPRKCVGASNDASWISYFTGPDPSFEADTLVGTVSVSYLHDFSNQRSIDRGRMLVSITFEAPISFHESVRRMYILCTFIALVAGRSQPPKRVSVTTTENTNGADVHSVQISHGGKARKRERQNRPYAYDVPILLERNRAEVEKVLVAWIDMHDARAVARSRYLGCLRKGNRYSPNRIVAAANMFDLLPTSAGPRSSDVASALLDLVDDFKRNLRQLPPGIDRDSLLGALGRVGAPTLPRKIAFRAETVEKRFGRRLPQLSRVAALAVKLRNHYVHGASSDFDFSAYERFMPFLTDTLEFIFAASDLIDSGWDAAGWAERGHSSGHTFSRYLHEYKGAMLEISALIAAP